jgi:hypothetical protein
VAAGVELGHRVVEGMAAGRALGQDDSRILPFVHEGLKREFLGTRKALLVDR